MNLLPIDLRFEHGGAKLASCPGRHLNSLRPWDRITFLYLWKLKVLFLSFMKHILAPSTKVSWQQCIHVIVGSSRWTFGELCRVRRRAPFSPSEASSSVTMYIYLQQKPRHYWPSW